MLICIIDGNNIPDKETLHNTLADSLKFPEWYGRNLDALYDCLSDLQEETEIRLLHVKALEKHLGRYAKGFENAVTRASQENLKICFRKEEDKTMLFIEYPKCSTCQKAKKWLDEHRIEYTDRHIVENHPSFDELKDWYEKSGMPLKKFFNTSGMLYKELQLKDRLPSMSEEDQLKLLAGNGMLVKRPLIIDGDTVLTGFKEAEWMEKLST